MHLGENDRAGCPRVVRKGRSILVRQAGSDHWQRVNFRIRRHRGLDHRDDVRYANGRLVIFSVHSQTSAINFGSLERGLDLAGLDLTKYSPETCATSGEVARYRD